MAIRKIGKQLYSDYQEIYTSPSKLKEKCRSESDFVTSTGIKIQNGTYGSFMTPCDLSRDSIRNSMTPLTALARFIWINGMGTHLNRLLRKGSQTENCLKPLLDQIKIVFSKYPKFSGTVYRGVGKLPEAISASYQPGNIVSDRGFNSTSKSEKIVRDFFFDNTEGWFYKITTQNCRDISTFNRGADEVLCFPGTRFRVDKRDDQTRTIWMTEID